MKDEEKIYGLIAQAEEIQEHTVHLYKEAKTAIEEMRQATSEARNENRFAGLVQSAYIMGTVSLVVLVVSIGLSKGLGWYVADQRAELAELKSESAKERETIAIMKEKTWSVELVKYDDGRRGIILPKGVRFDQVAMVQDGRDVVLIRP